MGSRKGVVRSRPLAGAATIVGLTLSMVCAAELRAQDAGALRPRFVMASWTEQDGLPSNQVEALAQTPDGYLWVGTQGGLVRFDGVRFARPAPSEGSGLPTQGISSLHTGRDGNLWVGYGGNGGVSRIDRGGRVTNYAVVDGLTRGRVHALVDTADGTVWAGGLGGLLRLHHERWVPVGEAEGFAGQTVISLYEDRHGNLWVGADTGVFVRKAGGEQFTRHSALLTRANGISEDLDGSVWISTPTGVFRGIGIQSRTHTVWRDRGDNYFRLRHDRQGNLWVPTLGGGLLHVPGRAATTAPAATRLTTQTGLAGDLIWALLVDREDNIWIGTQTGLGRLTPSRVLPVAITGPSTVVRAVESTRDGTIWAATPAGLIRLVKNDGDWQTRCEAKCNLDVTALHTDRHDTLWVAALSGLYRYERGRLVPVADFRASHALWVVAMTSDYQGGLWIRDRNGRLLRWRAGEMTAVDTEDLRDRSVLALHTDRRGDVWVGFADGGIVAFQGGNAERPVELRVRGGDSVSTFIEDRAGGTWVGTATSLTRFEGSRVTRVELARAGLPGGNLSAILNDDEGNLWLGIRGGIVRLAVDEFERAAAAAPGSIGYRLLDTADGLNGSPGSIGRPTAVRGRDGTLAFITGHSVSMVSPDDHVASRPPLAVRIEGVLADQQSFPLTRELQVPPRTDRIQIDFTAMTLDAAERVRFRYQLEGFDDDWVDAGHGRQAVYTNLPPGPYRFRVAARNKEGLWSESSPTVGFVVQPSFYQTSWFVGGWVALAGTALWGAWLLRVRRLHQGFAVVLTERSRVAREIHDTLLQTLVGLTLKVDAVEGQIDSTTDTAALKRQLVSIRRQLQGSIRETRESIRDLRCHVLDRRSLAVALREAGEAICGGRLSFELGIDGQPIRYPEAVEAQLLRITQESLNNAVRHAKARSVRVALRYSAAGINLCVADDGSGFDPDDAAGRGDHWGVTTMRERAAQIRGQLDIRSQHGEGTVVEVSVPAFREPARSCS